MSGPASPTYTGWRVPTGGGSGQLYVAGTLVATYDDATNDVVFPTNGITVTAGGLTVTAGGATITAGGLTVTAGGLTVTAGGATITAGNLVTTAGDNRITAGNVRLGAVSAFGTTEPTSWIVFKSGTQPAGAITTSGGLGANDTTVQKIIAAGTINNVET